MRLVRPHLVCHKIDFEFPTKEIPAWSSRVERWYQLDPFAFGMAEMVNRLQSQLNLSPARIFSGSPGASTFTDLQFSTSGAKSPARFVHTLPNIRVSTLLEAMEWRGPTICYQNGSTSFLTALREALFWNSQGPSEKPFWIVGTFRNPQSPVETEWSAVIIEAFSQPPQEPISRTPMQKNRYFHSGIRVTGNLNSQTPFELDSQPTDGYFWDWLEGNEKEVNQLTFQELTFLK